MAIHQPSESFLTILRREPEQAHLLIKFGLAAPLFIALWDLLGRSLLPPLAVALVTLLLITGFAAVLCYLMAKLVHSADQWQVDSAMQTRRLYTGDPRRPGEAAIVAALPSQPAPSFHQTHFFLRLDDEVQRARREGSEMCVLALDVTVPGQDLEPALADQVGFEIANLAASQAKVISLSTSTGPTEFIFSLPAYNARQGKDFVRKVVQALGSYWCHFGLAVYPADGSDAESLFNHARLQCEMSRQDADQAERTPAEQQAS